MRPGPRRDWSATDHARIADLAARGRSLSQAARELGPGVTRNMVIRQAVTLGVRFEGEQTFGGGCTPEQARQGWATRRARMGQEGRAHG